VIDVAWRVRQRCARDRESRQEDVCVALEVEAINPIRIGAFPPNLFYVFVRWEVTCGFCRVRSARWVFELFVGSRLSWVGCPACGTHNLLPHHPKLRDRGP